MVDFSSWGLVVEEKRVKGVRKSLEKQTKKKSFIEFLEKNRKLLVERGRLDRSGDESGNWKLNKKGNKLTYYFMCLNKKVWMNESEVGSNYVIDNPTFESFRDKLDLFIVQSKNIEEDKFDNLFYIKKKVDVMDGNGNVVMKEIGKGKNMGKKVKETKYVVEKLK
jgi:hypothetical protein